MLLVTSHPTPKPWEDLWRSGDPTLLELVGLLLPVSLSLDPGCYPIRLLRWTLPPRRPIRIFLQGHNDALDKAGNRGGGSVTVDLPPGEHAAAHLWNMESVRSSLNRHPARTALFVDRDTPALLRYRNHVGPLVYTRTSGTWTNR